MPRPSRQQQHPDPALRMQSDQLSGPNPRTRPHAAVWLVAAPRAGHPCHRIVPAVRRVSRTALQQRAHHHHPASPFGDSIMACVPEFKCLCSGSPDARIRQRAHVEKCADRARLCWVLRVDIQRWLKMVMISDMGLGTN